MSDYTLADVLSGDAPGESNLPAGVETARLRPLMQSCAAQLTDAGYAASSAVRAYWVPGRIEVLGKHTDYAGGQSLLMAAGRGLAVLACDRDDVVLDAMVAGAGREAIAISPELIVTPGGWRNYPMTVARRLMRNFGTLSGCAAAIAGDLPPASGMSSSSAMLIGFYLALADRNALAARDTFARAIHGPQELAEYLSCAENGNGFGPLAGDRGVGTAGGSEDHTAILCCRAGELGRYNFAPLRALGSVPLADDLAFAVGVSGVTAVKTGGAMADYNRAAAIARAAVEAWNRATGRSDANLGAALASAPGATEAVREVLAGSAYADLPRQARFTSAQLAGRFEQFQAECRIVEDVAAALGADASLGAASLGAAALGAEASLRAEADLIARRASSGDSRGADRGAAQGLRADQSAIDQERLRLRARIGELVDRSQELAERYLGNQVAQTIELARSARRLGAVAASAFGAGFGGSVWAMVSTKTLGGAAQFTADRANVGRTGADRVIADRVNDGGEAFLAQWRAQYVQRFSQQADACEFFITTPAGAAARL